MARHYNSLAVPTGNMPSTFLAPDVRQGPPPGGLFTADDYARQRAYFAGRHDLSATPLVRLPALAAELGLATIWVKDETRRFGLPAFKGLGAGFALAMLDAEGELAGVDTLVCANEPGL